jgi:hypothetical protein
VVKRLPLVLVLLGACAPDVAQNPPPAATIVAEFDPGATTPIVPTPNDLAIDPATGKVNVPASPADTPAQKEFNAYLNALNGFPQESTAQVLVSGPLDPTTVGPPNILVIDLTVLAGQSPATAFVDGFTSAYDPVAGAIDIQPPPGGWLRKHRYAVQLTSGLKGAQGEAVIGTPTWALVLSPFSLVKGCATNAQGQPDLTSAQCTVAVDVIPSTETDPAARLHDQTAKAIQLEQLRLAYLPVVQAIEPLERGVVPDATNTPILWTFTIVDAGEVTFDPANGIIPFPNDVLLANGKVALPNPATGAPLTSADCDQASDQATALRCGLNTLDGFSTIAPPISENGPATDAVSQGHLDAVDATTAELPAQPFGLVPLASTAPAAERTIPAYHPCLNCLSSLHADGSKQTSPQEIQWRLDAPLDEKTRYLAYITGDLKDDQGKNVIANPVFALVRSKAPISVLGKSQVNIVSDAQASQLEPLRRAMAPAFDGLEAAGVARANLVLAWAFTTQSEATVLDQLRAYPDSPALQQPPPQGLPQGAIIFADATTQYTNAAMAGGVPSIAAISKFYLGVFLTPVAITGKGGTLDPLNLNPKAEPVTFALAVPGGPMPAGGYPITIFGHGLTRDRNDFLGIANTLAAAGQATIATDVLFHGDRSSCTGVGAYLSQAFGAPLTDDAACANPTTMKCNEDPLVGRCVARDDTTRVACPGLNVAAGPDPTGNLGCKAANLGACEADGKCEGGDFLRDSGGRPSISGWNIFSLSNFFSTRDNFRQQVIDLAQLVHTLRVTGPTSLTSRIAATGGTATFDLTKIGYVGQSLGGILGTLYNAVSPDTNNVVLNVPGGDVPQIILNAPSFAQQKGFLLAGLAAQTPPIVQGTPQFDQFLATVQWIIDPADPANMGYRLTHPVAVGGVMAPNASRNAFIQFIEGDETVPNISNFALLAAADRPLSMVPPSFGCVAPLRCYEFTQAIDGFDMTSVPTSARHGFLLQPPALPMQAPTMQALLLTAKAQTQVATFLATGNFQ